MPARRQELKEGAGKALVRRTGTLHEVVMLDEESHIFKVRYLCGKQGLGASNVTAGTGYSQAKNLHSMEAVVEREDMSGAYRRVRANKSAPGVDGLSIENFMEHLNAEWQRIEKEL